MRSSRSAVAASLAAAACLVAPAVASARTKTVYAGPDAKFSAKFQKTAGDGNAFFRRVVTIHAGDKVRWRFGQNFHSVTFSPAGSTRQGLISPDADHPVPPTNDAAGQPYWFSGAPSLDVNLLAALPNGGKTFSPAKILSSGIPITGPNKPYTLTFKKAGTYHYYCIVHPGMTGTVKVLKRGKAIPTAKQDRAETRHEEQAVLHRVQGLATGLGTAKLTNTLQAGNDRKTGATVYDFFPKNPTVHVGVPITLRMAPGSTEVHTFTFGPSNGKDQYVDQIANDFGSPSGSPPAFSALGGYPSENPADGVPTYTGANHGNGFFNTGALDNDPTSPLPSSTKVTFTKPGTYSYICVVHPFMHGQVTVVP
jgi:plastocyanin